MIDRSPTPGAPKSWVYQTWIYVGLMGVIKLITTLFIQMHFWDNVKDFVLSPFGDPRIELVAVMLVIPFFVNVSALNSSSLIYFNAIVCTPAAE